MFDLFTYFIYLALLIILILLASIQLKEPNNEFSIDIIEKLKIQHLLSILIIALFIGFRYKVGVDWEGYRNDFFALKKNVNPSFFSQSYELGYYIISLVIAKIGLSYQWLFFLVALISWIFIYKSIPTFLLPLLIFFIFVDEFFFWSMNGMRQYAAMSIWLFSIRYLSNKQFIKYIICILFASLFHTSALLFIPLYFIPYQKLFQRQIWFILFIISFIIGSSGLFLKMVENSLISLSHVIPFLKSYLHYIENNRFFVDESVKVGFGFYFRIIVNALIIFFSYRVVKTYPKTSIYFVLLFFGIILFNLTYNISLLGRFNNYFLFIRTIVLAILVYYYWRIPQYRIFVIAFCFLYFILFIFAIYNSSNLCNPFRFILY